MKHLFYKLTLITTLSLFSSYALADGAQQYLTFKNDSSSQATVNVQGTNLPDSTDQFVLEANKRSIYMWSDPTKVTSVDWVEKCTLKNSLTKDTVYQGAETGSGKNTMGVIVSFDGTNYTCYIGNV